MNKTNIKRNPCFANRPAVHATRRCGGLSGSCGTARALCHAVRSATCDGVLTSGIHFASGVFQHCDRGFGRNDARMYGMCSGSGIQAFSTLYGKHPDPRFNISDPLEVLDYCRAYTTRLLLRTNTWRTISGVHVPAVVAATFTEKPRPSSTGGGSPGGSSGRKDYSNASPRRAWRRGNIRWRGFRRNSYAPRR